MALPIVSTRSINLLIRITSLGYDTGILVQAEMRRNSFFLCRVVIPEAETLQKEFKTAGDVPVGNGIGASIGRRRAATSANPGPPFPGQTKLAHSQRASRLRSFLILADGPTATASC
jgi:hypothetical protein